MTRNQFKLVLVLVLTALLAALTGCDGLPFPEGNWPGTGMNGIGFEMTIDPLDDTTDMALSCTMRSSQWSGEVPCSGLDYWQDFTGGYVVVVESAPPDARMTFTATYFGWGSDEDRAFCSNSPEEYVDAYYNGFPLDERRGTDCELDVRMDDIER